MTTDDSTYIVLELPCANSRNLVPGARLAITDLDSVQPVVHLQDGSRFEGKYEESLGTQLVFLRDEAGQFTLQHKTDIILKAHMPVVAAPAASQQQS